MAQTVRAALAARSAALSGSHIKAPGFAGGYLLLIHKYVEGYDDSDKQEDYPSKSHTDHVNYVKHGHSLIPLPKMRGRLFGYLLNFHVDCFRKLRNFLFGLSLTKMKGINARDMDSDATLTLLPIHHRAPSLRRDVGAAPPSHLMVSHLLVQLSHRT